MAAAAIWFTVKDCYNRRKWKEAEDGNPFVALFLDRRRGKKHFKGG
ncbi:hypothetical protein RV10_GL004794 [Enterococcus pallens]|nr:hypothetical protein RV10_GL004794 [Enterococcus pallens]